MKPSKEIIEHIKEFEQLRLEAYLPTPNDRWTIGYGNTFYEDGRPVKKCDKITKERAEELFANIVAKFSENTELYLEKEVKQHQFDALVSFSYNVGIGSFKTSTLLKEVNKSPNDYNTITIQFMRWNKQSGKVLQGLVRRRISEANIYCNGF